MRLFLALLLLCLPAAAARAQAGVRVPGEALVAVAHDALAAIAASEGIALEIEPAGCPRAVVLDGAREFELTPAVPADWLRARIGVRVTVRGEGGQTGSGLVWFAVRAPATAKVYAQAYARGAAASEIAFVDGPVDLARTARAAAVDAADPAPRRLRRAVRAGQPALAADFERLPAVAAQQAVSVQSAQGPVRLTIAGRALADGDVGETISVLPAGADRPVRARVLSPQVVSVEN
jgi:flagella basal body P-ring formation protein FlgA